MKKIYYLSTCDKCSAIIKRFGGMKGFEMQDIKTNPVSKEQLEYLKGIAGSYEALFSKRAQLYHEMKLKDKHLKEDDYKKYLLQDYTFLKRPVIIIGDQVFAGSEKKTIEEAGKLI